MTTDGMSKAWWAEGLIGTRNSMRLTEQLAKAHAFSHLEANKNGMARDDVVIDSPQTHNHYVQQPNPWPWIALLALILAAGLAWWVSYSRPPASPAVGATAPVAPAMPQNRAWLEFYRP